MRLMAEQPTGTVTMLFTDIEGSTRLLDSWARRRYLEALASIGGFFGRRLGGMAGCEVDTAGRRVLLCVRIR